MNRVSFPRIAFIRRCTAAGLSLTQIGRLLGLSRQRIALIKIQFPEKLQSVPLCLICKNKSTTSRKRIPLCDRDAYEADTFAK